MQPIFWPKLDDRRVLLAVSGGVAAYKAAELCRLLVRCGARVRVMMTESARQFVGQATFAALSGQAVATDLFDSAQETQIGHIRLAEQAEVLVVAPATAHRLAQFAGGLAGDLVSTVYLACRCPMLLAPAMNVHMWEHPATQHNLQVLQQRGNVLVGPDSGEMACGHVGAGRMAEPEVILQATASCLAPQDLAGRRMLVTAGPTHEMIDPVRYLGNRSSGKMGYALAAEAATRGGQVTLVSGPTALPCPYGVERVAVLSAAEMADAVMQRASAQDAIIMAAAVADYRPEKAAARKLKKSDMGQQTAFCLTRTDDILAALGNLGDKPADRRALLVGFAAETSTTGDDDARRKLAGKGCDLLVVNDVSVPDAGFDVDTNQVAIYQRNEAVDRLPLLSKREVAARIIDRVAAQLEQM